MNNVLLHLRHPYRLRLIWAAVYVVLIAIVSLAFYAIANSFTTHTVPVGQVELSIPYSRYLVGEVVTFTIKNNFNSAIYLPNNCPTEPLAVYRQDSGKWVRQHDQASLSDCPLQQRQVSVPANGLATGSFAPWHKLFSQPGKYRVVAYVEFYNALPYQQFEVIAAPPVAQAISPVPPSTSASPAVALSATGRAVSPLPVPTPSPPAPVAPPPSPPSAVRSSQTFSTWRGTLVVQYDYSTIYIISVVPNPGCSARGGRVGSSGSQIQVNFYCQNGQTDIQINVVNGRLNPQIDDPKPGQDN